MDVRVGPELVLADSGLPADTFNCVCRARLPIDRVGPTITEVLAHFRRVERPFSWWVSPGDQPTDLGARLLDAGLVGTEAELAMALGLDRLAPSEPPAGLVVRRVSTADELGDFARVTAANWTPPDRHVSRYYATIKAALLAANSPQRYYVGYRDDEPVAVAEMTVGGGLVGLYNIATLASHRRRGFGTALTLHPLLEARTEGYRTGVLQAAEAGVGMYRRIGFETFGDITEYQPR
jgi:ribosomal protein S18 acetylase RimI-like enzyme